MNMREQTRTCDDFFDSVAQTIFGIGLQLEHCLEPGVDGPTSRTSIDESIRSLHNVIQRIRERREERDARQQEDTGGARNKRPKSKGHDR
jgi:hypothetical protein